MSVVSLAIQCRMPPKWAWGLWCQSLALLLVSVLGLTLGPDWIFFLFAVAMVFYFYILPRLVFAQLNSGMTVLNADKILKAGKKVSLFYWGQPGLFWQEMAAALAFYIREQPAKGDELVAKWQALIPTLPAAVREVPTTYRLSGCSILWRWNDIIREFENLKRAGVRVPSGLKLSAGRAYAETGQIVEAAACLEEARLDESRLSLAATALSLLPFFALAGDRIKCEKICAFLSVNKKDLPEATKLYWLGRCLAAAHDKIGARSMFEKALSCAHSDLFAKRIKYQIGVLDAKTSKVSTYRLLPQMPVASLVERFKSLVEGPNTGNKNAKLKHRKIARDLRVADESEKAKSSVEKVWQVLSGCAFVSEIVAPRRRSKAIAILSTIIVVAYVVSNTKSFLPANEFSEYLYRLTHAYGLLQRTQVIDYNAYWRLISYMFLHAHISHLLVNLFGLFWFGRIAENIFGTSRFLAIFVVGGMLSGVMHVLLSDVPAVGASGGVMAIFGAVAAGIYRLKDRIPESVRKTELALMAGLAVAQVVLDQIIPHVAGWAHLGGILSGFVIGMLLSVRTPQSIELEQSSGFIQG